MRTRSSTRLFPSFLSFPPHDSPLRIESFFSTLYQRYEERFVIGAPLLADRGITKRLEWAPESPVFARDELESARWPQIDFGPRLATGVVVKSKGKKRAKDIGTHKEPR